MAAIKKSTVLGYLAAGDAASTATERGKTLEDLVCYIMNKVPGVSTPYRNEVDAFGATEIDIAVANDMLASGFRFLPPQFLIECKNHSDPVASRDVEHFSSILQNNGCDYGFLFAANGITGDAADLSCAHHVIADALSASIRIIVIDRNELLPLRSGKDLVILTKKKLCMLTARRTSIS